MHKFLKMILIEFIPTSWLDIFTYPLAQKYNKELADEVKVFADLAEVPFSDLFVLNFLYEIAAACSGILVEDKDGYVLMGRNLDFGLSSYLANLAYHAKYYKGGKLLYESIDLAGYRGLVTAERPDYYSFAVNEYFVEKSPLKAIGRHAKLSFSYLSRIFQGKLPAPYSARKAFESAKDYDDLVHNLLKVDTISRCHYIVSGAQKGQGAVISKFQDSVQYFTKLDAANGRWFIVQTNYQRDLPDPKTDNRRTAAIDRINKIGRDGLTKEVLLNEIMGTYPTFNAHTIHTTIMQVHGGYFNTTMWY